MKLTQEQIELLEAILGGEKFVIVDKVYRFDSKTGYLHFEDCGEWIRSLQDAGDLIRFFNADKITLPPKPLSDEMGEVLWKYAVGAFEGRDHGEAAKVLIEHGLLGKAGITPKAKRLLGEWLVKNNGGSE